MTPLETPEMIVETLKDFANSTKQGNSFCFGSFLHGKVLYVCSFPARRSFEYDFFVKDKKTISTSMTFSAHEDLYFEAKKFVRRNNDTSADSLHIILPNYEKRYFLV